MFGGGRLVGTENRSRVIYNGYESLLYICVE